MIERDNLRNYQLDFDFFFLFHRIILKKDWAIQDHATTNKRKVLLKDITKSAKNITFLGVKLLVIHGQSCAHR